MNLQPKILKYCALGLAIVLVLSLTGVIIYQKYFNKIKIDPQLFVVSHYTTAPTNGDLNGVDTTSNAPITTGTDWIGEYEAQGDFREYTKFFPTETDGTIGIDVNWDKIAAPVSNEDLVGLLSGVQSTLPADAKIFKIGTVISPDIIKNRTLYSVYVKMKVETNEYWTSFSAFFDGTRHKFIVIADADSIGMCSKWSECNNYTQYPYVGGVIDIVNFKNIKSTDVITIPQNDSRLVRTGVQYIKEGPTDNDKVAVGGIIFDRNNAPIKVKSLPESVLFKNQYGEVFFENGCYKLIKPDGSYQNYELLPYFLSADKDSGMQLSGMGNVAYNANITWLSGHGPKKLSFTGYDLKNNIGCGQLYNSCSNIVNGQTWFDEKELIKVAVTKKGEYLYGLKNKQTNSFYREAFELFGNYDPDFSIEYDNTSTEYLAKLKISEEKMWKKFITEEPLVFWKDGDGNWRVYRDAETFFIAAECGKPVIYLYPEKNTDVNVKVAPNGGLTKVEPAYPLNGWNVRATPQSEITDLLSGQKYPYLFWEGKAYNMVTPDYGFVLKREEVGVRMKVILAKLGLNEKETSDFLDFWQPKLEVKPYVFVTFVPQKEFDKLAPLTITPVPDKIIRVFMDYSPLEVPTKVMEPQIHTPVRSGFTVVEWGGRLK